MTAPPPILDAYRAVAVRTGVMIIPVATMAAALANSDADLGDERSCIRELHRANFMAGDICAGIELAIERARVLRAEGGSRD